MAALSDFCVLEFDKVTTGSDMRIGKQVVAVECRIGCNSGMLQFLCDLIR